MGVLAKLWYFLVFILIIALLAYGNVVDIILANSSSSMDDYLKDPQRYGGSKKQLFGKVLNTSENSFYFDFDTLYLNISGSDVKKAMYGETVALVDLRKDGVIEMIDYHNYNYNYLIYIFSFLAFAVFLVIFFREWRITLRGFEDA